MSPLNSLRVSLIRKLDFPAPASPAKTRRYIGAGSSVSSMSASKGCAYVADDNKLTQFYMGILLVCGIYYKENVNVYSRPWIVCLISTSSLFFWSLRSLPATFNIVQTKLHTYSFVSILNCKMWLKAPEKPRK